MASAKTRSSCAPSLHERKSAPCLAGGAIRNPCSSRSSTSASGRARAIFSRPVWRRTCAVETRSRFGTRETLFSVDEASAAVRTTTSGWNPPTRKRSIVAFPAPAASR